VTEVNLELAIVHGIFAQVTFGFAGFLVLACGRWWHTAEPAQAAPQARSHTSSRLLALSSAVTLLVFAQLVVAAVMRHYQAGMAVPDFPLSYGRLVPPMTVAGLDRANELRAFDLSLPPTSLGLIWLHTTHRIGAVLIAAAIGWLAWSASRARLEAWSRRHIWLLVTLLVVQLGLGMTTIWMRKPADIATAHVAVGALLLLTAWLLTVRLWRARRAGTSLSHQDASDPWHEAPPRQSAAHAPVAGGLWA
jgi:cytochrome c oxidase assembly protein subunit 15